MEIMILPCLLELLIPLGMSGLKLMLPIMFQRISNSHPAWDEWIEIVQTLTDGLTKTVLIPLGMSGLKLYLFGQQIAVDQPVSSRLG